MKKDERKKKKKENSPCERKREREQCSKKKSEKVGLTSVERKILMFSNRIQDRQAEN